MSLNIIQGLQLSPQQRRVWRLQRQNAEVYRSRAAVAIEGPLDPLVLAAALDQLGRRHEILRTGFRLLPGMSLPVQVIAEDAAVALQQLAPEAAVDREQLFAHLERESPDLEVCRPLQAALAPTGSDRYLLLLTLPALCADARGLTNLVRELAAAYAVCLRHGEAEGEPLQYADLAGAFNDLLEAEEAETARSYWRRQATLDLNSLRLPFEAQPARGPFTPCAVRSVLEEPLTADLERLAEECRSDLAGILLTAWQALLARLCGREDMVVGCEFEGRLYEGLEDALGLCARLLPVSFRTGGAAGFRAALAAVEEKRREIADLQDYLDVENIVGAGADDGAEAFLPFAYRFEEDQGDLAAGGARFHWLERTAILDRFGLQLAVERRGGVLSLRLHYDVSRFTASDAEALLRQLAALLASAAAAPEAPLTSLGILSAEERHQLLVELNGSDCVHRWSRCLHELFLQQVERTPDETAVEAEEGSLTYRELADRAERLARKLRALGVGPDARVAICAERSLGMITGILGTLMAGGAYVPLDPGYPEHRLDVLLEDARPEVMLTQGHLAPRLGGRCAATILLDEDPGEEPAGPAPGAWSPPGLANLAYVVFTSGSTGRPKGVMIPHAAILNRLAWMQEVYPLTPADRLLQKTSFSFDASVWEVFIPLFTGARLVLARPGGEREPAYLVRALAAERISVAQFVPSVLRLVLDEPGIEEARDLRRLFAGGEALADELRLRCAELPGVELVNLYGPTETAIDASSWPCVEGSRRGVVPIGRPLSNLRIHLLDPDGGLVPIGLPGEVHVGGVSLARGYLGRPELTARSFVPDPLAARPGERLYRTGDLAYRRADGVIEYLGRIDQQIKLRGFRIEPDEIAAAIRTHPGVRAAVVVAREDEPGQVRLVAYVVPAPGAEEGPGEKSLGALRSFLDIRLPEHMVPAAFVLLPELPLLPNGKLDRSALPAPEQGRGALDAAYAAPRNPLEELLAGIWEDLLAVERVGIHDDFFALGGHSLLATRVVTRLRQVLGVDLRVRSLFEAPTVASLAPLVAATLGQPSESPGAPIQPAARDREIPLSFAQERIWFLHRLGGASAYNLLSAFRLRGPLDPGLLARSLAEVVRRHEILRTTFVEVDGRPVQVISPAAAVPLETIDVGEGGLAAAVERAREEAGRPFSLERSPLIRALLLPLEHEDHALVCLMHHIVGDGWSSGVLMREVSELYTAFAAGRPSPLPELPIQYADYAIWQRDWLQGEILESQLAYWRGQLAGSPMVLDLPTDRPRPPVQSYRGSRRPLMVPVALTALLRTLSRSRGATLFMTLLATFDVLLSRYSSQEEVVVGAPVANRGRVEVEGLIGVFINTLALRTDLRGDPAFAAVLGRCREAALGAYAHQELPFERLVDALQPVRDLSRSPVFQVMLILQNTPMGAHGLPDVEVAPLVVEPGSAKLDLTLELVETEAGLAGSLEYVTALFDTATVDRMAAHLLRLLESFAADPDLPALGTSLMTTTETRQVTAEWNDTAAPALEAAGIHELFARRAQSFPDAVAVISGDRRLTYAELDCEADRLARELRERGVGPESRVAVCLGRSVGMVVALLGVLKSGAAYVPLDPDYPQERLRYVLEDCGAAALVTEERLLRELPATGLARICVDAPRALPPAGAPLPAADPDHLAYVIYTSGTTGRPKGVMVTHRTVGEFFRGMDRVLGTDPGVWLAVTSISFDISVLELLWTLTRGFEVVIQRDPTALVGAPAPGAARRPMEFSLFYFANDEAGGPAADRYRLLLEGARLADRYGFSAVWTPERHFHSFGGLYPNPAVTSAALAVITERVQIRAGSVVLPLHHPIRVAEEWSVVDNLSRGRVGVSFASGWHADDFVLRPEVYRRRREVMLRDIEVVRRLWRGEPVTLPGGTGQETAVSIRPRPLQAELPVWLTAAGNPETFRVAGEIGANLLTHLLGQDLEELAGKIAVYRRAWKEHGHAGEGHVSLMLHTFVGDDEEQVLARVREPFKNYLRGSAGLLENLARALGQDLQSGQLSEADMDALLEHAVERYIGSGALIGTVASCGPLVERLRKIGVDEAACLIDFGVEVDAVLDSLGQLAELQRQSRAEPFSEPSLAARVADLGITHLQCTPSLARVLADDPQASRALGSLRALLIGGEALPAPLATRLSQLAPGRVRNLYGPTETTVWSATHPVGGVDASVPIGRPIAGTRIHVVDRGLAPLPAGVPGELVIGGAGVVRGYLGRPSLTAERFVPDPFTASTGDRLYRTGDLARFLADGRLEFLGRLDHQVKIRGHRIELAEIETVLAGHPGVAEAVVTAVPAAGGEPRLTAYYVPTRPEVPRGSEGEPEAGRLHLLPNGMRVAAINDFQANTAFREIFVSEVYLRHGITVKDSDVIFDVGANSGFFSLFVHQRCQAPTIYAFEPIPPTFATLRANAALHGMDVKLFPYGLSNLEEEAVLTFYRRMPGLSGRYSEPERDKQATKAIMLAGLQSGLYPGSATPSEAELDDLLDVQLESEPYSCRLRRLSDVIDEQGVAAIDLLKIDVERAEVDVLQGIRDEHWSLIRQAVLEVDTRENLAAVTGILRQRGFDVKVEDFAVVEADASQPGVFVYMVYAVHPTAADRERGRERPATRAVHDETSPQRLREYLKTLLPDAMVPAFFVPLPSLPRTPNGKVDRRALPAPAAVTAEAAVTPPRTLMESRLVELWRQVLHVERVGLHDNFFELGGDSILAIRLIARAAQAGLRLTPRQIFQHQTVAELAQVAGSAPVALAEQGPVTGPVPLTPIQHWFFEQELAEPHHFNQALLLKVVGGAAAPRLAGALGALIAHHDALRLRFTRAEGEWRQVCTEPGGPVPFQEIDLAGIPAERLSEVLESAGTELHASLALQTGPLLRLALFRGLPGGEGRLLIIVHHLVVDGISWRVLLEDLQTGCEQLGRGEPVVLPAKTTSFKAWAEWLAVHAASEALRSEAAFWQASVPDALPRMPVDFPGGPGRESAARTVTVALDAEETRALLQVVPAAYLTQIDDVLMAALLRAWAEWTGEPRLYVEIERHGREEIFEGVDLSRTAGWFSTFSPLFLELSGVPENGELLRSVKERLRRVPGRGIGYGMLRYLTTDPEIASGLRGAAQPEISFNYLGQLDQALSGSAWLQSADEPSGPAHAPSQIRRYLLDCVAGVSGGRLWVQWKYSADAHRRSTIERLAQGFVAALRSLIPGQAAGNASAPSFPLAGLDGAALESLVGAQGAEDVYPLSPVQQGLLFHTLSEPLAGFYIIQFSCVLAGRLDEEGFAFAWREVMARHPVLRSSFAWRDLTEPLQIVRRDVDLPLIRLDWSNLSEEERQLRLAEYLEEDRRRGHALDQAPLMRLALIRLGEDRCQLVWSHHHLLLDGWSEPLVIGEVFAFYESRLRGREPQLERPRPYRDFIAWLRGQDLLQAERFWRDLLRGFKAPNRLRRDGASTTGYAEEESLVSEEVTALTQAFARQHRLTLNTLVQGVWTQLLGRLTGDRDLVFGVVSSGRPAELAGVESMVGTFINTLPLRLQIDPDEPLLPWLRALQERQVELLQYEYSPLVDVQGWSEVPRGVPLFESVLVFENFPMDGPLPAAASGIRVEEIRSAVRESFPLTLIVHPGKRLVLRARYDRTVIADMTARETLAGFERLLALIAADPEASQSDLSARLAEVESQERERMQKIVEQSQREKLKSFRQRGARPDAVRGTEES